MKSTANMATFKERVENGSLQKTIDSLYDQFDVIRIHFNGYRKAPAIIDPQKKIQKFTCNQDLADNGKFTGLDVIMYHERFFTVDDDIIYPHDYRIATEMAIEKYGCIITYHGKVLQGTGLNYYRGHKSFRCFDTEIGDKQIDVCGTGVTAFDTRYFMPKGLANHELKRMSDLIFSLEAAKQNKKIGMIGHNVGWIQPIHNTTTIFDMESHSNQEHQNRIADEIYTLKHKL